MRVEIEDNPCGSRSANLGMMTIDERIERLTERVEGLVMTAELHQQELQTIGSHIKADAENIRALARIAEIHERRLEALEGGQP
jgi:archaellum component FlaC